MKSLKAMDIVGKFFINKKQKLEYVVVSFIESKNTEYYYTIKFTQSGKEYTKERRNIIRCTALDLHPLINMVFKNEYNEEYKVIEYIEGKDRPYYKIKFLEDGIELIREGDNIKKGIIKHPYRKTYMNIASVGVYDESMKYSKRAYSVWEGMIKRCYYPSHQAYKNYGGSNVTVCDRWLCFEYFLDDLIKINNWDIEKFLSGSLELDKDKNCKDFKDREYNLESCEFITRYENAQYRKNRRT